VTGVAFVAASGAAPAPVTTTTSIAQAQLDHVALIRGGKTFEVR